MGLNPDYDDDDYDDDDDTGEWQEGQCCMCTGSTAEDLQRAAEGSLIPVCACAIGQGASLEDCQCGTAPAVQNEQVIRP